MRKERKCVNPDCISIITSEENPKKKYCSIKCKNRDSYQIRLNQDYELNILFKQINYNYKMIERLFQKKLDNMVDLDTFINLGFLINRFTQRIWFLNRHKNKIYYRRINNYYYYVDYSINKIIFFKDIKEVYKFHKNQFLDNKVFLSEDDEVYYFLKF